MTLFSRPRRVDCLFGILALWCCLGAFGVAHPLDEGRSVQEISVSFSSEGQLQVAQRFLFDETISGVYLDLYDGDQDGSLSVTECTKAAKELDEWAAGTLDLRFGQVDAAAFAVLKQHYKARFNLFANASNTVQKAVWRRTSFLPVKAETLRIEVHVMSRFEMPKQLTTAVVRTTFESYFGASTIRADRDPRVVDSDLAEPEAIPFSDRKLFRQTFASLPKKRFAVLQLDPRRGK